MFEKLKQNLLQLNLREHQKLLAMTAGAIVITAIVVFSLWRSTQNYVVLFGGQEQVPTSQVIEVLSGESIKYRIEPNSGQILVLEADLSKVRMLLTGKGIKVQLPSGYELMEQEAMLGSSQFIQNVRYKRSLEGELAQSIMGLKPVAYARVHLGISESSSFVVNNKPDSSASIAVRLHYGQQLNDEQIGSIIQLVSGSVPGLKADKVQVVDQEGHLLSERYQADNAGILSMRSGADLIKRLQNDVEQNVSYLLLSLVGNGNYRVSVMPRLDLSKIEETQERFSGDPKVNSENIQQENTSDDLAQGVPGALSNRPANQANPGAPMQATRNHAERRYNYDRDIRHIVRPGFKIEKMSVAIILNRDAPALKDWTDEQQAELNKLLVDAAGIDSQRGDSLTLSRVTFDVPSAYEEQKLDWWQDPIVMRWIEMGGIGLLVLLLLIFGVIPWLRRSGKPALLAKNSLGTADEVSMTNKNTDIESSISQGLDLSNVAFQRESNLPPQSSGLETKVEYLQLLVETETERVAEVIKQWINSNDRSPAKPEPAPSQPQPE